MLSYSFGGELLISEDGFASVKTIDTRAALNGMYNIVHVYNYSLTFQLIQLHAIAVQSALVLTAEIVKSERSACAESSLI